MAYGRDLDGFRRSRLDLHQHGAAVVIIFLPPRLPCFARLHQYEIVGRAEPSDIRFLPADVDTQIV